MAFIVEDGSGIANANSLLSVEKADEILMLSGTWNDQTTAKKEALLLEASILFTNIYGHLLTGEMVDPLQELPYPRINATLYNGTPLPDNIIPNKILHAIASIADTLVGGGIVQNELDTSGKGMLTKKVVLGPIESETEYDKSNTKKPIDQILVRANMFVRYYVVGGTLNRTRQRRVIR